MSAAQGQTVARRRLRIALRAARENAQLTQEQSAAHLEWSHSKLIRIEAGTVGVTATDVKAMLQLYGVNDQAQISDLVSLARVTRKRDWLAPYKEHIPPVFAAYLGLEREASAAYFLQHLIVPGVLQTPRYATTVIDRTAARDLSPEKRRIRAQLRMERQKYLLSSGGPDIHALLDESLLLRMVGDEEVMREQLLHLAAIAAAPGVTVQVLPLRSGVNTSFAQFILLEFHDGADSDVVFIDTDVPMPVLDRVGPIAPYRSALQRLMTFALSPEDSITLIEEVAGEYR